MDNISITYDDHEITAMLVQLRKQLSGDMRPVMRDIAALIKASVQENFIQGGRPDAWPESQRVRKSGGQTLVKGSRLLKSIKDYADSTSAVVGTNVKYAAIHQFGGEIKHAARSQKAYFKTNTRTGEVGNRFVKKSKSNFSQWVTIGDHSTTMPARPFLMIQDADQRAIVKIIQRHLQGAD